MQCLRYVLPCGVLVLGAGHNGLRICVWDVGCGKKIFDRYSQGGVEWCEKGDNVFLDKAVEALDGLTHGLSVVADFPMDPIGTDFQKNVWKRLLDIRPGETATYSQLAAELGTGARAIGNAVGANPLCVFVPCHRVVAANGGLGGYAGGLEAKKWLLEREIILAM